MSAITLIAKDRVDELAAGFAAVRRELDVPEHFDPAIVDAAIIAAGNGPVIPHGMPAPLDRTDLALVTIDPPGSIDLDQAFAAEQTDDGYRVWYAIADVAAWVQPGSPVDAEALRRGVTLYSPDMRASLHPEIINEDVASLLQGQTRNALLWQIDLDDTGALLRARVDRAIVRSRRQLTYAQAQDEIDQGGDDPALPLLRTIGMLRQQIEADRGAISLRLPSQEITREGDNYRLHYDTTLPVEGWNAQISLLTGIAAAQLMTEAGHGLLRTLPPLDPRTVREVRRSARGLGVDWPEGMSYPDRMRALDPADGPSAALLTRAARSFRGAGYVAFSGHELPEQPLHGAIASTYAHVTAPLRRVCDRYTNELLLAISADVEPPQWALERLDSLPEVMGDARRRDGSLERAMIDYLEAMCLRSHIGEEFEGVILSHARRSSNVQLRNPAVVTRVPGQPDLGTTVSLRLEAVDTRSRKITFSLLDDGG